MALTVADVPLTLLVNVPLVALVITEAWPAPLPLRQDPALLVVG